MNINPNEERTGTQKAEILSYLKAGGSLTPQDAWSLFGCTRLAARIYELRGDGYLFASHKVRVPTAAGRPAYVSRYWLSGV